MNERQLKSLFCSSLRSGHVRNNNLIPTSGIRIVEEAHSRAFDPLIAAVTKEQGNDYVNYNNMLIRTQLLERFAKSEKCRIDCVRLYPVEVKSDDDTLDERLPNQVIDAILTFGLSIVVLDRNHSKKAKSLCKFLPATVICYTGIDNYFELVSNFDRLVSCGIFSLNKASLARTLEGSASGRAYSRLAALERILQKLAFNQIYFENLGLTNEEIEFLQAITDVSMPSSGRKMLNRLVKETANAKMTDYL